ncbi:MAG TPA: alpha/beta hydrolase [bacterium]|nr:alpha/beta hydrolase [bacterium]
MVEAEVARRVDPSGFVEEAAIRPTGGSTVFEVAYLPAAGARIGVVICCPVLVEQLTNYRYEVLLARSLASRGVGVFRFHYRGTGHSGGEDSELSLDTMVDDALRAAERAQTRLGVDRLVLVGTRLGALVAGRVARHAPTAGLVFWAPVVDGARYLNELIRARLARELKDSRFAGAGTSAWKEELETRGWIDILGYALHSTLHRSVLHSRLDADVEGARIPALLVQFGRGDSLRPDLSRLRNALTEGGGRVDVRSIREEPAWFFPSSPMKSAPRLLKMTTEWVLTLAQ